MMGTHLHQVLRAFCFNTEWKYAVFWKLTHRARMMLTWEDAYYDDSKQHDPAGNRCFNETRGNIRDGRYSHDPLGLAVANMSYHVYSLGEGMVGQVAVSGKHLWICADKHVNGACPSLEHYDGWQTQYSAGIRTIVVVAVIPHGVVQLGCLNEIAEDLQLVNHIREVFLALQDSSVGYNPSLMQCNTKRSSCLEIISKSSDSEVFNDCLSNQYRIQNKETNNWSYTSPPLRKRSDCSYTVPLRGGYPRKTLETTNKHRGLDFSTPGHYEIADSLQTKSENFLIHQKLIATNLITGRKCEGSTGSSRERGVRSEDYDTSSSITCSNNKNNSCNVILSADISELYSMYLPSSLPDSAALDNKNELLCIPETFYLQNLNDLEKNLESQPEFSQTDVFNTFYNFSAGCELFEALGPAFGKQHSIFCDVESEKSEIETVIDMPRGIGRTSPLTAESEHLLEAVVANICESGSEVKSEKSCRSAQSILTTEKRLEPIQDKHSAGSGGYSFNQSLIEDDTFQGLKSSEDCDVKYSKGFPSTSFSTCSEPLERPKEPAKNNKKRARPGENSRPRPRDRQLIQDRIKELRELVPSGSKCSIDSLLDRTIKHMLFLHSITKYTDKLSKSTRSKLHTKETGIRAFPSYEQGSSWAMEVGNQLKVCPIRVENMNMDGQMVIEMLCDECCQFLEVAEAIKNLGLTILKGVTEAYEEKTWIHFIVEGQENRSVHRMDTLWSLLQIMQPNTTL